MDQARIDEIKQVIDDRVRPILQADGGDLELLSVGEDGIVHVRLYGACAGCASAQVTLSDVVETTLKETFPEITGVTAEYQVSNDLIQQALSILRKEPPKEGEAKE